MSAAEGSKNKKWKKVIPLVAAYLVAAWTFLQFVDWTLVRYQVSPYWVDILLWIFIGVLPSVIIYLFNSERINNKNLKLREKIIFPLNIFLVGICLFLFFGSSDLGSTTKEVTFTNQFGDLETKTITKEEFRIRVPLYRFKQKTKDTVNSWLGNTINTLIKLDLNQDKNFTSATAYADSTSEKVEQSSVFTKQYVDGDYEVKDGVYYITPILRNSKNGKEITRQTFSGEDFFSLIDQTTNFIKENLLVSTEMRDRYLDLDVSEMTTSSMKALEYWSNREYEKAVKEDDKFTLAYFDNALRRTRFSQGELEEKYLIDKAYELRNNLPLQSQFEILMYKHIVYERWEDAEELVKYQLEIDPNSSSYNDLLYLIYSQTKKIDEYYDRAKKKFTINRIPDPEHAEKYWQALIFKRKFDEAKKLIGMFELLAPNIEDVARIKAYTNLLSGDLGEAKKVYKKVKFTWPRESIQQDLIDEYIDLKQNNKDVDFNASKFLGIYRSANSEQRVEYYEKDGTTFVHYNNQLLNVGISAKENEILSLDPTWPSGTQHMFEKDSLDNVIRVKVNQFNQKRSSIFYYYLETDEIRNAYDLIKSNNTKNLGETFELLLEKHPEHWFLQDALQHVNYVNSLTENELTKQLEEVAGTYANRAFWVENNRLYYKRDNLARIELLPISKTRYINLSKPSSGHEFEFLPNGKIASFAWAYDIAKEEWIKLDNEINYFLKD